MSPFAYPATAHTRELDYKLAFHCAPVIAGVKPANILSIKKPIPYSLTRELARLARPFGAKGIYFFRLAECRRRILLVVYHRKLLQQHLQSAENTDLLGRYGYRPEEAVGQSLTRLSQRLDSNSEFPHEIGVFLGYPTEDVECFIRHGGQNCRLCGYWKVYGDVEEAKRIFSVYDEARRFFCQKVADGEEIYDITYGGMEYE